MINTLSILYENATTITLHAKNYEQYKQKTKKKYYRKSIKKQNFYYWENQMET